MGNPFRKLTTPTSVISRCCHQLPLFSTGHAKTASSRIIVTEGIHDRFVAVIEKMSTLKV
jgi:hypothetical protein